MISDRTLAVLCEMSYDDDQHGEHVLDITTPTHHGPRAILRAAEDHSFVLTFRGTNDIEGWMDDFEAWRGDYEGGKVHAGFLSYWRYVRSQVLANLGGAPVTITGHSLGGAVATLAAADAEIVCRRVVTFGSPRVGNADFGEVYRKRVPITTRYVNEFDPVPWVPGALSGYRHVAPATWYNGSIWGPYSWSRYLLKAALAMLPYSVTPSHFTGLLHDLRQYHDMKHYARLVPEEDGVIA